MLGKILGGPVERRVVDASALTWGALFGSTASKAGVTVSVETAMRVSTAFACVRAIAEDLAQIPLKLMLEAKSGKKSPATAHALYDIMGLRPNSWQSSHQFRETLSMHAALIRGGFAWINRVGLGDGEVEELLPLPPATVTPQRLTGGEIVYNFSGTGTGRAGVPVGTIPADQLLRIEGPSWNGYMAMELVNEARDAIGLSIATEEAQSTLHANGVKPGALLTKDGELNKLTKERTRELIANAYGGSVNAGKLMVLDGGWKFQPFAMTGVDAETLASRRYQVEEIARMFGVPPTRIGYSDKASTYASAEQFALQYVRHTIGPWVNRWEQSLALALLTPAERRAGYYFHFVVDGLLRGDWSARSAYFKAALGTASSPGWMSPNDVRRLEEQDPSDQEGADDIITPADMSGKMDPAAEPANPAKEVTEDTNEPADPAKE